MRAGLPLPGKGGDNIVGFSAFAWPCVLSDQPHQLMFRPSEFSPRGAGLSQKLHFPVIKLPDIVLQPVQPDRLLRNPR